MARSRIIKYCSVCANERERHTKQYCSVECQNTDRYNNYIKRWLTGEEHGNKGKYQNSISNHVRRYMFEINNNKCCKCGWSEVNQTTGKIPLEINHIDGNHKNTTIDNLELICPNCHSLTSTYRSLNTGNGRIRN